MTAALDFSGAAPPLEVRESHGLRVARIDVSEDDYHADKLAIDWLTKGKPTLSASLAKVLLDKSPAHAFHKHPRLGGGEREHSDTFDRGKLAHKLLLGKGAEIVVVEADAWTKKDAREQRDAARAEGKIPALRAQYDEAQLARDAWVARLKRFDIELDGASECQFIWEEEAPGYRIAWCRAMIDHVVFDPRRRLIVDLKTCRSAHERACAAAAASYGYDLQAHVYTRAVERWAGEHGFDYVNVFAETTKPYALTPTRFDDAFKARGEQRWREALDVWATCLAFNKWPEYVDQITTITPPAWAIAGALSPDISFEGDE